MGDQGLSRSYDIIVVGAGIVGCACARECVRAGLKTLLLDRGPVGGGTTAAGMGHIVVLDESETLIDLCAYSQTLWREFAKDASDSIQWRESGTLWVAADEEEMQTAGEMQARFSPKGMRTELLDSAQLKKAEPNLRDGLAGALRVSSDAVVYSPSAAKLMADQAAVEGCEVLPFHEVNKIRDDGTVVLVDGTSFSGGIVLNATGYWSPKLTPGIDVFMRKGHLVVTNRYPGFVRHQLVELGYTKSAANLSADSVAFNIHPRADGKFIIGSSRQSDAVHSEVDHKLLGRMLRRAFEYMPGLNELWALRCWTGFRPSTSDKLPLIGPISGNENIWLATGHEGLGITASLATGRLIAEMATGRSSELDPALFAPGRHAKIGEAER